MANKGILFVALLSVCHFEYGQAVCNVRLISESIDFAASEIVEYFTAESQQQCTDACINDPTCAYVSYNSQSQRCGLNTNPSLEIATTINVTIYEKLCTADVTTTTTASTTMTPATTTTQASTKMTPATTTTQATTKKTPTTTKKNPKTRGCHGK
ncbi:unnamed protein product [Lymnaea stagnalis]|uniref:Apple domain-containing protein n=1 Tax=Lymnaea stagnalis TaxID=6523 RepID=A0AAV2IIC7_LYMST